MAPSFEAVSLNHIARETLDTKATAKFYQDLFGFERIEAPKEFGDTVIWLKLPPAHYLHIVQKKADSKLPESPLTVPPDAKRIESDLPTGHHLAFRVGDYDAAIAILKSCSSQVHVLDESDGSQLSILNTAFVMGCIVVDQTKKIPYYEKTQQEGSIKQCFFFDPEGNGIEIGNWPLEKPCSC